MSNVDVTEESIWQAVGILTTNHRLSLEAAYLCLRLSADWLSVTVYVVAESSSGTA